MDSVSGHSLSNQASTDNVLSRLGWISDFSIEREEDFSPARDNEKLPIRFQIYPSLT